MKKVIYFLMAGILACQFMITDVLAATELVTPDEIVTGANEFFNEYDGSIVLKNDSTNKKFIMSAFSDKELAYPYADEYFEINREIMASEDVLASIYDSFIIYMVAVGAYKSLGCTDEQIDNIFSWYEGNTEINNYDKYGVIVENDKYEFSEDESTLSGTYVKHFKFSFDKEKIRNAINDFSAKANPDAGEDDDWDADEKFVPSISFGTVTAERITIAASVSENSGFTSAPDCNIYRADSSDGNYKLIGTITCDGSNYFYDNDVVKGKKYFYKASVVGSNKLSDVYSTTAVTAKSTPSDNPDTGISMAYVLGALILVLTFATAIVFNRDKIEVK
ncbi:MAG: hypothetical protein UE699_02580 [Bacilli bacterium]|nr:hypothetical protein [Bacilli bacterium]